MSWKSFWRGFGSILDIGGSPSRVMTDREAYAHNRRALSKDIVILASDRKGLRMENLTEELYKFYSDNPEADMTDGFNFIREFEENIEKTQEKNND